MIDENEIAKKIAEKKRELFHLIELRLEQRIRDMSPANTLTMRLMNGETCARTISPEASLEYAQCLIAFMKGNKFKSYTVDSYVTPIAVTTVENAIIEFYSSPEISNEIAQRIISALQASASINETLRNELKSNSEWLQKEAKFIINDKSISSVSIQVANFATDQMSELLQTAAGKKILLAISHSLSTTAGKIALKELILVAVKKVAASAALKSAIITILKKVSLAALMKTIIGKALLAVLALIGVAHIPIAWLLIPIIAGFLAYEYHQFPKKLSEKIPSEVTSSISGQFNDINTNIIQSIVRQSWQLIQDELTKPRA